MFLTPRVSSWRCWSTTWMEEETSWSCSVKEEKSNMTLTSTFSWRSLEYWSTMVRMEITDRTDEISQKCVYYNFMESCICFYYFSPCLLQMLLWGMCITNTSTLRRRLCPMVYWTGLLLQQVVFLMQTYSNQSLFVCKIQRLLKRNRIVYQLMWHLSFLLPSCPERSVGLLAKSSQESLKMKMLATMHSKWFLYELHSLYHFVVRFGSWFWRQAFLIVCVGLWHLCTRTEPHWVWSSRPCQFFLLAQSASPSTGLSWPSIKERSEAQCSFHTHSQHI